MEDTRTALGNNIHGAPKKGENVLDLMKKMFYNPFLVGEINENLINLIRKVDHVVRMKDFRTISLCNVSFKVITKILSHRLRPIIEKLVCPF